MNTKAIGPNLIVLFLVSACVTTLTPKAAEVRIVESKSQYNCTFVSTLSAFNSTGIDPGQQSENAMNELRNKAAQAGMNGVRIIAVDTARGATVTAEGLRCEFED